jgi:hypothetical protein
MLSGLSSRIAAAVAGARAVTPRRAARRALPLAAFLALSACSTSNVLNLRPDVDVGTTAALPRGGGMQDLVPDDPYLQKADTARLQEAGEQPPDGEQPVAASDPPDTGQPTDVTAAADAGETPGDAAADEPISLAGQPAAKAPPAMGQTVQPRDDAPVIMAGYPRMDQPEVSGPAPMPADELAYRRELRGLGVVWREMSPIYDSASCHIAHPIKVSGLPDGITLNPPAVLNAEMALTFAKWTKDELNPAARRRYWSRVTAIHQLSSYSCRRINGSHSMSQHATGNAIDVGRIELSSGRDIDVEKPGLFAFRTRGFLDTVRADGCDYFTTVLGPGYNYDHRNHFHFDIMPRRGGRHACH